LLTSSSESSAANKDALLMRDNWEMADALNRRLQDTLTASGPSVKPARDQRIRVGDVMISYHNDPTIAVAVRPSHPSVDSVDQVRNGNRWRVAAIDTRMNRLAAERLTDGARTVLAGDYLTTMPPWATPPPCTLRRASPLTPAARCSVQVPPWRWHMWP
jgi:hypothetical protein